VIWPAVLEVILIGLTVRRRVVRRCQKERGEKAG
jgi:hypothetical protein